MSEPSEPHDPFPDFESAESAEPVEPMPTPAAPPKPTYVPKPTVGPYKPSPLPGIITAMGLGALLAGGGILLGQSLPKPEPAAPAPAPAPAASTSPTPASEPTPESKPGDVAPALAGRVDGLGAEVKELAKRIDDVQKGLASLPKPEPAPAPDLKPIEAKIDALSKRLDAASPPDLKGLEDKVAKVDPLAAQAAALEKTIDAQKAEIAALQDKVKSLSEAKPAAYGASAPPAAANNAAPAAEADYNKAVDLFKKNQFAQARDAFTKLGESAPNDARVWYYAAVANGYATNAWTGETERLVTKGVEAEKAGTPDLAKINSAFADLAPPSVKGWLDAYRARAR